MALFDFDAAAASSSTGFSPLEPGEYGVTVTDTNFTINKSGNTMATVVFTVNGTKRKLFEYYSWNAPIGMRQLGELLAMNGRNANTFNFPDHYGTKENPVKIEEMHGMEATAVVDLDKKDATRNRIKKFLAAGQDVPF